MTEKVASPGAVATELDQLVERLRADVVPRCGSVMNERPPQAKARSWAVWTSRYGALPIVAVSGFGPAAEAGRVPLDVVRGAAVVAGEVDDRLPDELVRVAGVRPRPVDAEDAATPRPAPGARSRGSRPHTSWTLGRREDQDAAVEVRPERLEPELERGRDPEVPAGAAQAPEQLRLVGLARPDEPAVGGDELDRGEVVDREPELTLQATDAPAEGQPGDAGVADDADRTDEAVRLGGDVELAEERAAVRPGGPRIAGPPRPRASRTCPRRGRRRGP